MDGVGGCGVKLFYDFFNLSFVKKKIKGNLSWINYMNASLSAR